MSTETYFIGYIHEVYRHILSCEHVMCTHSLDTYTCPRCAVTHPDIIIAYA